MKNKEGHTLLITVFMLLILSFMCMGSMVLITNNSKVINKRTNYVYQEIVVTNSLFDVLNDLVEKEEIEIRKYEYLEYTVNIVDIKSDIYYIELYEKNTKLTSTVKIDLVNNEYNLLTLEVDKNV